MPSTIACSSAVNDTRLLLPGRLRVDRRRRPRRRRRDRLHQGSVLPLEGEGLLGGVLTQWVELHRALDAVEGDAALEVTGDLRLVKALCRLYRLGQDLPDRVG